MKGLNWVPQDTRISEPRYRVWDGGDPGNSVYVTSGTVSGRYGVTLGTAGI